MHTSRPAVELRGLEAARYALLRRLSLVMRHQLVVHLQPMGLITDLLERRLQQPEPPLAQIRESMDKVHALSRAAVHACLDVVSWLAPDPAERVALQDGVRECVELLRSSFSFRGFALANQVGEAPQMVGRGALRQVLPAAMLALTDHAPSPAGLAITARPLGDGAVALDLALQPAVGEPGFPGSLPYRLIEWGDVELLAGAEGVRVRRDATARTVQLIFDAAG